MAHYLDGKAKLVGELWVCEVCGQKSRSEGGIRLHYYNKHEKGPAGASKPRPKSNGADSGGQATPPTKPRRESRDECPECGSTRVRLLRVAVQNELQWHMRGYRKVCMNCQEVF